MRFIDLFCGLGGFHLALSRQGHECVFASEISNDLPKTYEKNFGLKPHGDIRKVSVADIPAHDILCAGFPCRPFSKAGEQRGFKCSREGDLFQRVMRIIRHHRPLFIILENVPNIKYHNGGSTWTYMERQLEKAGYDIRPRLLSPHHFGIPQIRERIFIIGTRNKGAHFEWPEPNKRAVTSLRESLDRNPPDARKLPRQVRKCLKVWQAFIKKFPKGQELPSFPIWSMEFAATYPFEKTTPHKLGLRKLAQYRGSHGIPLKKIPAKLRLNFLPSHARTKEARFPHWKVVFIRQNRDLYNKHKAWIKDWLPRILQFPSSLQKLEWHCKGEERDIWKYVIQFRASGVRVKRPTTAPSLIAMTTTQVPIIGWEKRYMTPRECARLQGMAELRHLPTSTEAFKALGNAVNVDLVEMVVEKLIGTAPTDTNQRRLHRRERVRQDRATHSVTLQSHLL
jgi:DNA (cytosine-5)-methyltransferase 1